MRVEILQELDPDDARLEVPWASADDPNLAYVDLKAFPDLAEKLDECRSRPALGSLLRAINHPDSPLRSAKCDVWLTHDLAEEERWDFDFPVKVGGYIDLLFDSPHLQANLASHLRLAEEIKRGIREAPGPVQMDIAVRRCLFHKEGNWGYYLTLFVHAYGASENAAETAWNIVLSNLREVLEALNRGAWKTGL